MSNITLASWNVNSLKVRLPQLLDWLKTSGVDAVVLQETKLTDDLFPAESIREAGYDVVFTGQKTYNGVALLSKRDVFLPSEDVLLGLPDFPDDHKRFVAATLVTRREGKAIRFIGSYFPNGMTPGSWKYLYKLDWLAALTRHLKDTLTQCPDLVLGGDFNIAPEDADVWNPAERKDDILVSAPERAAFRELLKLGLSDSFRLVSQESARYSWWDYRMKGFENNHGLRIDHLLVSEALKMRVKAADIDTGPRGNLQPSDHAPATVTLEL
ncbi:MAG: exodeoxyribonuclease III [Sutterella wadsworthensis]